MPNGSIIGSRKEGLSIFGLNESVVPECILCDGFALGGGGGGWNGGGGGGDLLEFANMALLPGRSYTVTIGAGGTAASGYSSGTSTKATRGSNTSFGVTSANPMIIAIGGGYGGFGSDGGRGHDGACGGGYGYSSETYGQVGVGFRGSNGGDAYGAGIATPYGSAGGGGMGGAGAKTLNGGVGTKIGGDGGAGAATSISGSSVTYGGGGGGSSLFNTASSAGSGGSGGGGAGGLGTAGTNGTANTGGGGGGAGVPGSAGNGGSGKFGLRYRGPKRFSSGYVSTSNGWSYHEWTSTTTFTIPT